jgi:hypothetical protein
MPRSDWDQHEKEVAPGVTARYFMAGRPRLRQRLEQMIRNDLVVVDLTIAEVQEFRRRQELGRKPRLPRGARWSSEHGCFLAPAGSWLLHS